MRLDPELDPWKDLEAEMGLGLEDGKIIGSTKLVADMPLETWVRNTESYGCVEVGIAADKHVPDVEQYPLDRACNDSKYGFRLEEPYTPWFSGVNGSELEKTDPGDEKV